MLTQCVAVRILLQEYVDDKNLDEYKRTLDKLKEKGLSEIVNMEVTDVSPWLLVF